MTRGPRLLLVDESPSDRIEAIKGLRKALPSLEIREIVTEAQFKVALEDGEFDAVITDGSLSWGGGLEILQAIKERYDLCPVIMYTGEGNDELAAHVMKAGLDSYISKTSKRIGALPEAVHSALKRSRERLRLREEFTGIRYAVENSSDAVLLSDLAGRPRYHNRAFSRSFGWTSDELAGSGGIPSLFVDQELGRTALERARNGEPWSGEVELVTRDGRRIPVLLRIYSMRDDFGRRMEGLSVVVTDISERKRLEETRRRFIERTIAAEERERQRIAGELHDLAGQSLTSLLLRLKVLEDELDEPTTRQGLQQIRSATSQTIDELARIARGLHPSVLEDLGLHAAISRYAEELGELHGLEIDLYVAAMKERLPAATERTLYRVLQEALTNVVKHAHAKSVSVTVQPRGDRVRAVVEDDGRGFDPEGSGSESTWRLGLQGMLERVGAIDGTLAIESRPGAGTMIVVDLPRKE